MTNIYFVRHAQSDNAIRDDLTRPLATKGLKDRELVTQYLSSKEIDIILSSPYIRAIDTVADYATKHSVPIQCIDDFRERHIANAWIDDFKGFSRKQWSDFSYKLPSGESLHEVQDRNIAALNAVLKQYPDMNIVIGTHGTALSTIIHYYDPTYGYKDFNSIARLMPWIVKISFQGDRCVQIDKINVFDGEETNIY